jgi:hypothetical protein
MTITDTKKAIIVVEYIVVSLEDSRSPDIRLASFKSVEEAVDFVGEKGLELVHRPRTPAEIAVAAVAAAAPETKLFDILAGAGIAKITYEAFYDDKGYCQSCGLADVEMADGSPEPENCGVRSATPLKTIVLTHKSFTI